MSPLLWLFFGCGESETGLGTTDSQDDAPIGDALMELDPAEIVWAGVDVGYSFSMPLVVRSIGDGDLEVYEISIVADPSDSFVFDPADPFTLAPGTEASFDVACDLETAVSAEGEIRVRSSDADQTTVVVPLSCAPAAD